ncbi:fasciclin domain-containing protein [Acuticoccus sp. MNP-M23]|uniref:fasciclin domain-containing protein n=1 Tax=Acuticoccus sp. MNP-M23 TaxID=3072793 RepID=UPI002815BC92|nr:fasciclin domain-containing protein [Acuticoccus sp. MNP-M23]WMS42337.1 fasciclin domain-containing protein [Acuticoccus sp. MNP-M23]
MPTSKFTMLLTAAAFAAISSVASAQTMPMVGGAPMDPAQPIPVNASKANNLTTLVAAVKAADLVDTLASPGPFTVFAPTNAAFEALPAGTVDTLLMPQNKAQLAGVLTYHVVAGDLSAADLMAMAQSSPDKLANLKTVEGGPLSVRFMNGGAVIYDESGNRYRISQTDVNQKNGVVHVIDGVLLPK